MLELGVVKRMDHTIVHFEIPVESVEKMRKFYSDLFDWKIERNPGPLEYWLIETVPADEQGTPLRPGVNGGMYQKPQPKFKPVNYISVESIDKYIEKTKALGGEILQPKQEVPSVGWVAIARDPEGNQFAMLQPIQT
ncbi:MAG: VOC family protein [Candidatus Bathyarchaeota archaeon]|nr:VOC family protein [Candidatus Bathyarchaeota archaeon]